MIEVEKNQYNLIKNERDSFNKEEFLDRVTDYYYEYDYIVGDYAYSKLRLKGFYKKDNKKCNIINDYSKLEVYIKNNCAINCKYYVLEKI